MRKKEQRLWDNMRAALAVQFYLERQENAVGFGRPDVDVMWRGVTIPIELKAVVSYPKRPETPILGSCHGLNTNQRNWWLTWRRHGGQGFIIVRVGHDFYCIPELCSECVNSLSSKSIAGFAMNWNEIVRCIKAKVQEICRQNQ